MSFSHRFRPILWIENKSDGISFVLAVFFFLSVLSYSFFLDWKHILRILFYSHALVSITMKYFDFAKKNDTDWNTKLCFFLRISFSFVWWFRFCFQRCCFRWFLVLNLFWWFSAGGSGHFLTEFVLILFIVIYLCKQSYHFQFCSCHFLICGIF